MIAVTITTHKRPQQCLYTLRQLPDGCRVGVFHDKCDSDYSQVEDYCKQHGHFYHKTSEHHGKWGFWKLHNTMYEYLDAMDFTHYIQLPDDALLVDNIVERAIALLQDDLSCVGLFTTRQALRNFKARPRITLETGDTLIASNWLDCCFVTTKKVMKGFRIQQNWRSIKKNELRSSGVGVQQAMSYRRKTGRMAMMGYYSLVVDYTEFDCNTVMHHPAYVRRFHKGKAFNLTDLDRIHIKQRYEQFQRNVLSNITPQKRPVL